MQILTFQTPADLAKTPSNAVYFIESRITNDLPGYIRIATAKNFAWYTSQLTEYNPHLVILLGYVETPDPDKLEKELRLRFAGSHHRGAWYRPTLDLYKYIRETAKQPSPTAGTVASSPAPAPQELLSVEELAQYLNVSVPSVRRWIQNGKIPVIRQGRLLRFYLPDVLTAIRSQQVR